MIAKTKYRQFCETKTSMPIFSQPWWLDTVCGPESWDVAIVEKQGGIVASMPFFLRRHGRDLHLGRPPLTQCLGPHIVYPPDQRGAKRISWEKSLMDELIDKLPEFSFFEQHFHHEITNWLPFFWQGFSQTTRYTYVLEDLSFEDYMTNILPKARRKRVNRAKKIGVSVEKTQDVEAFYYLNNKTFHRKGTKIPYSLDLVKEIFREGSERGQASIYIATHEGKSIAASFFVSDANSVYYIMGGIDPDNNLPSDLSAMDLLVLKGVELALESGRRFDFEGSMMESIEKYFRSFGAVQQPYFHIQKTRSRALKIKRAVKEILKTE